MILFVSKPFITFSVLYDGVTVIYVMSLSHFANYITIIYNIILLFFKLSIYYIECSSRL